MELKLLRIYRWIANFSTSLVSAFVPLIVYKYTSSLSLALLSLILEKSLNFIANKIFGKIMVKKPQLFLLIRLAPILLYEILVLVINANPILAVVGISIGMSLSHTFKFIPIEIIYCQNSVNQQAEGIGLNVLIDRSAYIFAFICGGLFLDFLPTYILIILSTTLYVLGTIPMIVFYIKNKNNKSFNEEYTAYAHLILKKKRHVKNKSLKLKKKIRLRYAFYNLLVTTIEGLYYYIPLFAFIFTNSFTLAATINITYDITYAISSIIAGKLDKKFDLTGSTVIGCILCSIGLIAIPSAISSWWIYIAIAGVGIGYAIPSVFMTNRMLSKSRLIGRSNQTMCDRLNMMLVNNGILYSLGFFAPILSWFFYIGSLLMIFSSMYVPVLEEESRALLVDYFQENDIPS